MHLLGTRWLVENLKEAIINCLWWISVTVIDQNNR